jgi:hypothetical protein
MPDITPVLLLSETPLGNTPEYKLYVTGASPVAATVILTLCETVAVPKLPAAVVHVGVPLY